MATAGYTTIGSNDYPLGSSSFYNPPGAMITMPEIGTITKITGYVNNTNGALSLTCGFYTGSAGSRSSLLQTTSGTSVNTTPSWFDFSLPVPYSASATTYWLQFNGTAGNGPGGEVSHIRYDTGGATDTGYTLSDIGTPQYNTNQYSLYATYTPNSVPDTSGTPTTLITLGLSI